MRVAHSGHGRVSIRRPRALSECDRCSFWYNLSDLKRQFQWAGNTLQDTGLLVCDSCLDAPQPQYRSLILPADPVPRINPRLSPNVTATPYVGAPLPTTPENQGFTQYVVVASVPFPNYPPQPAAVLANVAAMSGVATPVPASLVSYQVPMTGSTVPLVPSNSARTFLLLFNPAQFVAQISLTQAVQGAINNLSIGPNEAYFWSTMQGLAPVYQGAVTAIGLFAPLPLWAWEDNGGGVTPPSFDFANDSGVLIFTAADPRYPVVPDGLPPGAVWNNGLTIDVIPGISPNPAAPPVIFGAISSAGLLALGGGDLPTSFPPLLNQLWNNNGEINITLTGATSAALDFSKASNSQYIAVL